RQQPEEIRKALVGGYAQRLLVAGHPTPERPVRLDGRDADRAGFRSEVDRLTDVAMKLLFDGGRGPQPVAGGASCTKCHDLSGAAGPSVSLRIVPVPDRSVWFTSAKFDHAAHHALTCAACHPGTAAGFAPAGQVVEKEPVQILGIDSCRACHAPR